MHKFNFPAKFLHDKEEGGFIISFRDIPESITQAETIEECFVEAADCLEEAIAGRIDDRVDIPKPSKPRWFEHLIFIEQT